MNLAIADLLMGIYLLCLGIADVVFSGSYCVHELKWLTSNSCQALGSLVVISSEASIVTIIILTSCRMFAVFKVSSQRHGYTSPCVGYQTIVADSIYDLNRSPLKRIFRVLLTR